MAVYVGYARRLRPGDPQIHGGEPQMKVSAPKETAPGEAASRPRARGRGPPLSGRSGGRARARRRDAAGQPDAAYEKAGAGFDGFSGEVVAKVAPPSADEVSRLASGSV